MNIEYETKAILRGGFTTKQKVALITRISNFREEHILLAIDIGGLNVSDVYANIVKLKYHQKPKIYVREEFKNSEQKSKTSVGKTIDIPKSEKVTHNNNNEEKQNG